MIKRILIWSFAIVGILLLAAAILIFWPEQDNLDHLLNAGEPYDAEIVRDEWGVPHIFGRTDADAAYGLAYAHAEDDFELIQQALLAARGDHRPNLRPGPRPKRLSRRSAAHLGRHRRPIRYGTFGRNTRHCRSVRRWHEPLRRAASGRGFPRYFPGLWQRRRRRICAQDAVSSSVSMGSSAICLAMNDPSKSRRNRPICRILSVSARIHLPSVQHVQPLAKPCSMSTRTNRGTDSSHGTRPVSTATKVGT